MFKYLRRLVVFDEDNTHAVRGNLAKAQQVWTRISRVLRLEKSSAQVNEMFYKAKMQAILLFGSETWCLMPATL